MRGALPLFLAALGSAALACLAGPARADDAYDACMNASDGSNMAWQACGEAFVEREDGALNAAWKHLYGASDGQTKADLLAEQRAWVRYKEAACAFYANGEAGREGAVLDYPLCQARLLAERTSVLKSYDGDLSPR